MKSHGDDYSVPVLSKDHFVLISHNEVGLDSPLDTIVAPITAPGPAAVAAVRVSGPDAYAVASSVFDSFPSQPTPRYALYGKFVHGDDGLCLPFKGPSSFTGEDVVEFFIHGSDISVRELVQACLSAGSRMAQPGEFSLRAFINGRLDLTQAEAVADVIESQSPIALRLAERQLAGSLGVKLNSLTSVLLEAKAIIEAFVDFSEETGDLDDQRLKSLISQAECEFDALLASHRSTKLLRNGAKVVLVGKPNSGKSTLFNRLIEKDRAIVSPKAGTTRDTIEERLVLNGMLITLTDTAGIRTSSDEIEAEGVARAGQAAEDADLVLEVVDSQTSSSQMSNHPLQGKSLTIFNKNDNPSCDGVTVSALHGFGIEALKRRIEIALAPDGLDNVEFLVNDRHFGLLSSARDSLLSAKSATEDLRLLQVVVLEIDQAINSIYAVLGISTSDSALQAIFSRFCIGK